MTEQQFTQEQLEANSANAVATVEAIQENATQLVNAWVKEKNAAAVLAVAEQATGPARKAARRGLNVLRSRGVPIPEQSRTARIGGSSGAVEAELFAPDPAGVRVLVLKQKKSGGRLRATIVYLRDGHGVYRVETSETTSSKLRTRLEKQTTGTDKVSVPLDWARYKIAKARRAHQSRNVPEPLGFGAAGSVLTPVPETAPEHPFDSEGFALSEEDAKELALQSGQLHSLPEFRAWLPSPASVQGLLTEVGKKIDPANKPDEETLTEFLKEEVLNSTDRHFTEEVRQDIVERMKDAGLGVLRREGEPVALRLAATMQAINAAGLITDPPRNIPFLCAFFEKALTLALRQNQGRLNIPIANPSGKGQDAASEG